MPPHWRAIFQSINCYWTYQCTRSRACVQIFLLARLSSRLGDHCRYPALGLCKTKLRIPTQLRKLPVSKKQNFLTRNIVFRFGFAAFLISGLMFSGGHFLYLESIENVGAFNVFAIAINIFAVFTFILGIVSLSIYHWFPDPSRSFSWRRKRTKKPVSQNRFENEWFTEMEFRLRWANRTFDGASFFFVTKKNLSYHAVKPLNQWASRWKPNSLTCNITLNAW